MVDEPTPLDRAAWVAVRGIVVVAGVVVALLVASRLRIVLVPVAVALLLAAPLRPIDQRLERFVGRTGAAILSVLALLLLVFGTITLAGTAVASDLDELQSTVTEGVDDIEAWLVDLGISRSTIQDVRQQLGEQGPGLVEGVRSGAVVVAEVVAGALLAVILAVFVLRDSDAAVEALARRSPPRRAARIRLGAAASWKALRRYLLGAAVLGVVEAAAIGTTVALVGSPLALPVAVFTFVAAFVPIVGAIVAGIVACLAALVSGGAGAAVIVGVVALVVQQLDGDLLAPIVYGRASKLHPAAVLVAITTGTAIAGLIGAVLAVPLLAVAVAVARATGDDDVDAEVRGAVHPVSEADREAAG